MSESFEVEMRNSSVRKGQVYEKMFLTHANPDQKDQIGVAERAAPVESDIVEPLAENKQQVRLNKTRKHISM